MSSPRVCGDVSYCKGLAVSRSQFSPRMRGYFSVESPGFFCSPVLPAYAGMFPASVGKLSPTPSSPRVCGDVSLIFRATLRRPRFSPRMRGCFYRLKLETKLFRLLPRKGDNSTSYYL